MRLASYEFRGRPQLGVRLPKGILPLADLAPDLPDNLPALLALGAPGMERVGEALRQMSEIKPLDPADLRSLPPITQAGKILCLGLNYADHAAESGMPVPKEPVLFTKAPNCVVGPNDDVVIPKGSIKTDWEVELAIVIGSRASYVSEDKALAHIAGYCICNDVSEREFQLERSGQWVKGKSAPTFGPLGPWLVTPDEIENVQALNMWLDVSGERMQTGSTATMVFGVKTLVSYISQFIALEPGDVITTGTPPGVGSGKKPPRFLKAGDTMALGIDGLGRQDQHVVAWKAG